MMMQIQDVSWYYFVVTSRSCLLVGAMGASGGSLKTGALFSKISTTVLSFYLFLQQRIRESFKKAIDSQDSFESCL
jgi:hypothetical protein